MTDRIGVLGVSSVAAIGTNNAYTVSAGKGARCRIHYRGISGVSSTLKVLVNGITMFQSGALTTVHCIYSSSALPINDVATAATLTGATELLTCLPYERDLWLDAGDRIDYVIGTADFSEMIFQVVGTEVSIT